jgi:site-specific recombinase XerD
MSNKALPNLSFLLETFFTKRLMQQRQVSSHTISSYRDTFRLFLEFARRRLKKAPSVLTFEEIDAPLVGAFLQDLEKTRGISARTRNLRLTAVRSFFHYASFELPDHANQIQRVLAVPGKRFARRQVAFLCRPEIDALLAVPDKSAWSGRRDHALLLVALQTGLRQSEITALRRADLVLGTGAHVRVLGKGRKERCTPFGKQTVGVLKEWLREPPRSGSEFLFPNAQGGCLSADGAQYILHKHLTVARARCPSLREKRVTLHVLRHTAAMELLQAGVDRSVIALWLGHESVETTQIYLEANLELKEKALSKITPPNSRAGRYRPDDRLLAFLKGL